MGNPHQKDVIHKGGSRSDLVFFTICSNNYLPQARVWLNSVRALYSDIDVFIFLSDEKIQDEGFYPEECVTIQASDIGISEFKKLAFFYDILEFNTALKPFMFLYLIEQHEYERVVYFDSDIQVFNRLRSVELALDAGASLVLTPHLCRPAEMAAAPSDLDIMRAGVYNLGFLASSSSNEAKRILHWWARRLRYECLNRQDLGIFVDQKFMDLVPGFGDSVRILRDETLNVAYWNLPHRRLERVENGWLVNGEPLTFFHYSGFDASMPARMSKYTSHFSGDDIFPSLRQLIDQYVARLAAAGDGGLAPGYAYDRFASGTPIHPQVRRLFREQFAAWDGDPFETFETFLHSPSVDVPPESASMIVTVFMKYLWDTLPQLQQIFQLNLASGANDFVRWYLEQAAQELQLDIRMIEPVFARAGRGCALRPPGRSQPPDFDLGRLLPYA